MVANDAHINTIHDLRGARFCHPGHGLSRHWTDILANVCAKFNEIPPKKCFVDFSQFTLFLQLVS